MRQRLITIGTLLLAAGAYYVAEHMTPGGARDGVLMVAGALVTLQAQPVGRAAKAAVVAGLVLLAGCGASVYDSTLATINRTATTVSQSQPAVVALCQVDPGQRCDDARKAYETAGAAVAAAHDALEVYRVTGEGLDATAEAVRRMAESAREVGRVLAR